MDYEKVFNAGTILMEPRLQEYCKRKQFNKDNNIETCISEEKEFNITAHDLKIINKFKNTNKVYTQKQLAKEPHFVKPSKNTFKDNNFMNDPRYERIKKKLQSHKDSQKQIRNFDNMDKNYGLFHKKDSIMTDSRSFSNSYYKPNNNNNINMPKYMKLHNNNVSGSIEHGRGLNDIISNVDTYNKHLNRTYEYVNHEIDLDTRTFTPGLKTDTQREINTNYQSIPFGYGNGMPDIAVENSLKGGIRDSSKKSIGFKNPFENQFYYISTDISDPNNTVQQWAQNTRGQNKDTARTKKVK